MADNKLPVGWGSSSDANTPQGWGNQSNQSTNSESDSEQFDVSNVSDEVIDNSRQHIDRKPNNMTTMLVVGLIAVSALVVGMFGYMVLSGDGDGDGGSGSESSVEAPSETDSEGNTAETGGATEITVGTTEESTSETTTGDEPANMELDINQAIEDFLMQFPMMFGGDLPDGAYSNNNENDRNVENWGYFDRNGNRLTEENTLWVLGDFHAVNFNLYDFDADGIPEILVEYTDYRGFTSCSLFRFVDGEYRRVRVSAEWSENGYSYDFGAATWGYYRNNDGDFVRLSWGLYAGSGRYNYIKFDENTAEFNIIFDEEDYMDFVGYTSDEYNDWSSLFQDLREKAKPHNIPGTDIRLTPIEPLTALQTEIESNVRSRLNG